MKSIHRDLVKIRALIEAIKEAKIAGYVNPVLADWVSWRNSNKELIDQVRVPEGIGGVRSRILGDAWRTDFGSCWGAAGLC